MGDPDDPGSAERVTLLLSRATAGDRDAGEALYDTVYDELRRMARGHLLRERSDHTMRATDLVHEAFLRLVGTRSDWQNRAHFLAAAGRAMRQILVDHARSRNALKRGGGWERLPIEDITLLGAPDRDERILALDDALGRLESLHPEKARIVELHVFAGFTQEECARVLGVSRRTILRHWEFAQAWLFREMAASP